MKTRVIALRIDIRGKAPAKYGPNTYKVTTDDFGWLFLGGGWDYVESGRVYEYARPPEGKAAGTHYVIKVEVPTDAEIERIAMAMHRERRAQTQAFLGFLAEYRPARQIIGEPNDLPQTIPREAAEFVFGVSAPWRVTSVWTQGDDSPPVWHRHESRVVEEISPLSTDAGDIFVCSWWRYAQKNVNFFQVLKTGEKCVLVQEIEAEVVPGSQDCIYSCEQCIPKPGVFRPGSKPVRKLKKIAGESPPKCCLSFEHGDAYLWDGWPPFRSWCPW